MNPTWELLPIDQLCRMLARKSGKDSGHYRGWTRASIYNELSTYEAQESVVVKEVSTLDAEQLAKMENMLMEKFGTLQQANELNLSSLASTIKRDIIDAIKASQRVVRETIILNPYKDVETNLGRQHMDFKLLLDLLLTGQNVLVVGPAGSGKTSAAHAAAKAMGLPFHFNGAIDNEYKLLGFTDAQGRVVHRPFREAYTKGGVYLFDEVDASLPSAVLAFNAALANEMCDFPDACVERHPNFHCIAAGNTFYGADHQYVGRMKQDAAFLDRFLVLDWNYDEDFEHDLGISLWPDNRTRATKWFNMILKTRKEAATKGMLIVISPRATIGGIKLLRQGISWDTAVRVTLRKTMKQSDWEKIERTTNEPADDVPKVAKPTNYNPVPDAHVDPWYDPKPKAPSFVVKSHGKVRRRLDIKDLI